MIRVGVIGASFAKDAYLPALAHIPGVEAVALASHRIESATTVAKAHNIPFASDDWADMIASQKLDLVCIATPTDTHLPMTLAALDAGAHVMCEKPTAMNSGEARQMLERARARERLHMIDHELRFNPNRARMAEMIANGDLGTIRHVNIANISAAWADPASRPRGDWWSDASRGGGRLGANGSHQVDMLRWLLGEPTSVVGKALTCVPHRIDKASGETWTASADDLSYFMVEMACGAMAQVFISAVAATTMGNETQVFGSRGTLTLSNSDERLYFAKAGQSFQDITVPDPNAGLAGLNKGIWTVSVLAALGELTEAIAQDRALRRGATFVDGLRNQMVLDAVIASAKSRQWEDLDMSTAV